MEFVVSLPMPARIQDQYIGTLMESEAVMNTLIGSVDDAVDGPLMRSVERLLSRLKSISTHVDLENETATPHDVTPDTEVRWAVSCSGKFQFLQHLLNSMRHQAGHIAIVAGGGRLLDILEKFLIGLHIDYNRPDAMARPMLQHADGQLHVSLIASGEGHALPLPKFARLIIAFDTTFNAEAPQILALRRSVVNLDYLSPVVHLLVYCSAEHITKCIPKSVQGVELLKTLICYVAYTRKEAGELLPSEASPMAAAEEVAAFIEAGGLEGQWTLPSIRPINVEGLEYTQSTQSLETASRPSTQMAGEAVAPAIRKRGSVCLN
jgi:hypothetical protein